MLPPSALVNHFAVPLVIVMSAHYVPPILYVAGAFALVNLPSVSLWTALGTGLQRFLSRPVYLRRFNIIMALLLVASLYPVLWP